MAISRWRIALTGAATIALAVVGVGLVQGAQERPAVNSGSALFEEHKERQD
nr:hypothetical protein [Chloroflexota bacterium]